MLHLPQINILTYSRLPSSLSRTPFYYPVNVRSRIHVHIIICTGTMELSQLSISLKPLALKFSTLKLNSNIRILIFPIACVYTLNVSVGRNYSMKTDRMFVYSDCSSMISSRIPHPGLINLQFLVDLIWFSLCVPE